jgi:nitrate reductase gamma subunit
MLLALAVYGAYAVFLGRVLWRILNVLERPAIVYAPGTKKTPVATTFKAVMEVLFLSRLARANPGLWIGEWGFHFSLVMVIIRHLGFVLNPVPGWVAVLRPAGVCAGYVLPFSLLYILIFKLTMEKKKYISSLNFFLLGVLLLISVTGVWMRAFTRPDVVLIKGYMLGVFRFSPGALPEGVFALFPVHLIAALVLLVYLPAHIFAAPISVLDANEREEGLRSLIHDE